MAEEYTPRPKPETLRDEDHPHEDDIEWVSKSEMKREMKRFQTVAEQLIALPKDSLSELGLNDSIIGAVREARRLKKQDAVNRQVRHIARLLQKIDIEPIRHQLDLHDDSSALANQINQLTERWRDALITDTDALSRFFDEHPQAERQAIGQLVRNTRKACDQHNASAEPGTPEPKALQQKKRALYQALRSEILAHHKALQ